MSAEARSSVTAVKDYQGNSSSGLGDGILDLLTEVVWREVFSAIDTMQQIVAKEAQLPQFIHQLDHIPLAETDLAVTLHLLEPRPAHPVLLMYQLG